MAVTLWNWNDSPTVLLRRLVDNVAAIQGGGGGTVNLVAVPASPASPGAIGDIAQDTSYFYVYTAAGWTRAPISDWS